MKDLQTSLLEVIRASLPEQTAGELKNYIAQAERDKEALEAAKSKIDKLEKDLDKIKAAKAEEVQKLNAQIVSDTQRANEISHLENLKKINEEAMRNIDVTILRIEKQMLQDQARSFNGLMEIVFRNPRTVTNQTSYDQFNYGYDRNGQQTQTKTGTTVTTSVEEVKDTPPGFTPVPR